MLDASAMASPQRGPSFLPLTRTSTRPVEPSPARGGDILKLKFAPRTWKGYTILGVLIATATVVAAVLLFQSSFPAVPVSGAASNCATLSLTGSPTIQGQSGSLLGTCNTNPAFTVTGSSGGFTVTPTFSLTGTGYSDLNIYPSTTTPGTPGVGTSCSSVVGVTLIPLTSGTGVVFSGGTSFSYCADYASVPAAGLAAFSVTWNA